MDDVNLCVVDTSNEICGEGDIPHPCVGLTRRMMVPHPNDQKDVMIECLQNHTPDVIVIDEVGRKAEVEAAKTVKERGVRLLASAHGDLRSLVRNKDLNGMVGGVSSLVIGDAAAAKKNADRKTVAERSGQPTFDVVIELDRENRGSWTVVMDVAGAVDSILKGGLYRAQKRTRDSSGEFFNMVNLEM